MQQKKWSAIMYEFKMPALGAEMTHGILLEWKVKVGDKISRHDIIAVIDTDKAAIEIESFGEGIVEKLITPLNETVPVGTVMALIRESAEEKILPPSQPKPEQISIKISPLARKLAKERGIDISKIKGSGPDGAIVEEDIQKLTVHAPLKEDHTASMKKVIAAAMARSKREIPHYYLSCEMDLSNALAWLENYNNTHPVTERMLYVALLIKAAVNALKKFPEFNGFFINNNYEARKSIHLGMAISLREGGLIAPAILNADKMNLIDVMNGLNDLVIRARTGKLRGSEISDPTITITNLGELGVDAVFGIIYPPQVALIGFGRISLHKTIQTTLSADHRVSNGISGSRFLAQMNKILQEPEKL